MNHSLLVTAMVIVELWSLLQRLTNPGYIGVLENPPTAGKR